MKAPVAYVLGIIAAAALPVIVVTVTGIISGAPFDSLVVAILAAGAGLSIVISAAVGGPTLAILHKLHAVRWLWLGLVGYGAGFLLYGLYLISMRNDLFALPMSALQNVAGSAVGGAIGWVCASTCWFTIRWLMRPNTSLERRLEG